MENQCIIIYFALFSLLCSLVECDDKNNDYDMELKIGNPDNTEKIERPCPVYDLNCIRVFFKNHAHCKKTFGPVPDPLFRGPLTLNTPRVNLSIIVDQQGINNLNAGRVEEFYINRDTDNLVISVQFRNMTQTSQNNYFVFNRRAKEPVVTLAFASVTYTDVVITCVVPKIDDLRLQDAECTTFSNGIANQLTIDPSAGQSSDPQVQATLAAFLADLATDLQEIYLTDSAPLISTFIQYNICDFGLLLA